MNLVKKISATFIAVFMIVLSTVVGLAAELTINDATANVGDKVTYTLNLSKVATPVAGIQMSVYYDSEYLQLDTDSVSCDGFAGYMVNTNLSNQVLMNASEGVNGYDFTNKNEVISLTFTVLKEGKTDITYYVDELYDIYEYGPGDYLKTYTFTTDISVNGASVIEDAKPVLNTTAQTNGNTGDFVNNEDATGEISYEKALEKEDIKTTENLIPIDDLSDIEKPNSKSNIVIILLVVVCLAVIAVVTIIIVKAKSKNTKN